MAAPMNAKTYFVVGLVLSWIWVALIILLNVTVIVIICGYRKRSRLYFFLLNLAIADLAMGVVDALPHALERTLGLEYVVAVWEAGDLFCRIQRTAASVCMMSSNYILAAMSMDRAYVICKPMMSLQRGNLLQKVIIISCWLFCFAASAPLLKYSRVTNYPTRFPFSHKQQCVLYFGDNMEDVIHGYKVRLYLMFVLMFLVPFCVIIASYSILIVFIYKRARKQTASEKARDKHRNNRMNLSRVFNKALPKSKMKSIKLTLGIVSSFFVCWTAFFTGYFLAIYAKVQHPLLFVLTTFYYWNSLANPLLFFLYHRRKVAPRSPGTSLIATDTFRVNQSRSKEDSTACVTKSNTGNTIELLLGDDHANHA